MNPNQRKGIEMVTKMNESRKSVNDASATGTAKPDNHQAELAKRTNERVAKAIKERNESFVSFREAAASSLLMLLQYGRPEKFNELFRKVPAIDGEALRNRFVAKVIETYGSGGTFDENEGKWVKRHVAFILYRTDDALRTAKDSEKGQNFILRPTDAMKDDDPNKAHIKQGRENVIAAGEEGLMQIEWLNRGAMVNRVTDYDREGFYKDLERLLQKAAKEAIKADSDISASTITEIMRVAAMPKARKATVLDILSNDNTATTRQSTPENSNPRGEATVDAGKAEATQENKQAA
jgi:hypothetical protein